MDVLLFGTGVYCLASSALLMEIGVALGIGWCRCASHKQLVRQASATEVKGHKQARFEWQKLGARFHQAVASTG